MKKAIFAILLFCFAVFSVSAQVENNKTVTDSQKNTVEQNKMAKEKMDQERAAVTNQANTQVDNPNAPVITFDKLEHDYGTIAQGGDGNSEFRFTNNGKEPLILSNVRAS
jgi:hypothetical protein